MIAIAKNGEIRRNTETRWSVPFERFTARRSRQADQIGEIE